MLICFVFLIIFSAFFWLYEVKFFVSRAGVTASSFSIDNSYLFVTPLRASANGQDEIRLTIFLLNNQGLGVKGKKVIITPIYGVIVESVQGLTDSYGKAYFDVTASIPGEYLLDVIADNNNLKQKAHFSFY